MDGTFKIVKDPFKQLFSIHAFVTHGQCTKQVPLAFALMSRREWGDYKAVLEALLGVMTRRPSVRWIMMDFEAGELL